MKILKKCFSTFMIVFLLFMLSSVVANAGSGTQESPWTIGTPNIDDVIAWEDEDKTLHISGTGDMKDFTMYDMPGWNHSQASSDIVSVIFENGVTSIGAGAFNLASNLINVTLPDTLVKIGRGAFWGTGLTSVTIPASVTQIDINAFKNSSNLISVTFLSTTPATLGENVFENTNAELQIYVPYGTKSAYDDAPGWSNLVNLIEELPGVFTITNETSEENKDTNNGFITIDKVEAQENETITVSITPNDGYQLKSLTYNDGEDHDITLAKSFTMPPSNVTIKAEFEQIPHVHGNGQKQEGLEPTADADGYKSYYKCECGKYFEDEACTKEIIDIEAWKLTEGKLDAINDEIPEPEINNGLSTGAIIAIVIASIVVIGGVSFVVLRKFKILK